MVIHIGKIIHKLVSEKGIKAKHLAKKINVSEATIYKIYRQRSIDVDKLIKFSGYLETNLFNHYLEKDPLKTLVEAELKKYTEQIDALKADLDAKTKRIQELENINTSQQKIISILEKTTKG